MNNKDLVWIPAPFGETFPNGTRWVLNTSDGEYLGRIYKVRVTGDWYSCTRCRGIFISRDNSCRGAALELLENL